MGTLDLTGMGQVSFYNDNIFILKGAFFLRLTPKIGFLLE